MPVATREQDWSDSDDDDEQADVETFVLLGIPDGTIDSEDDLRDAAVSRIGGHPAFLLSTEPPLSCSQCKNCSFPMELLVQIWCPFEESNMDRALYVFGCARGECQRRPGSVRAFRGLRYNSTYAAKLERKREKLRKKEAELLEQRTRTANEESASKTNPFSMGTSEVKADGGLFGAGLSFGAGNGLGAQLFGAEGGEIGEILTEDDDAPLPPDSDSEDEAEDETPESDSDSDSDSGSSMLVAPVKSLEMDSSWLAAPAYKPAYYLSTSSEYIPPAPRIKAPTTGTLDEQDRLAMGKSKKAEEKAEKEMNGKWEEGYEDNAEIDKVFEKFARIAGYEGQQCIRYELGGTPLPFSRDATFSLLFPSSMVHHKVAEDGVSITPQSLQGHRIYDPKSAAITACPRCGGSRTFECQIMPHLIAVLRDAPQTESKDVKSMTNEDETLEARRQKISRLLSGGEGVRGMEWGTCLIFSCAADCAIEKGREVEQMWAEELVHIQWEE